MTCVLSELTEQCWAALERVHLLVSVMDTVVTTNDLFNEYTGGLWGEYCNRVVLKYFKQSHCKLITSQTLMILSTMA